MRIVGKANPFKNTAGSSQQSLFGEGEDRLQAPTQSFAPEVAVVRQRLEKLLTTLRASSSIPWPEREARMWQNCVPADVKVVA